MHGKQANGGPVMSESWSLWRTQWKHLGTGRLRNLQYVITLQLLAVSVHDQQIDENTSPHVYSRGFDGLWPDFADLGVHTPLLNFFYTHGFQSGFVANMRNLLSFLLLALLGLVQAIGIAGDRLLVVLEDESQKASFSQFWADLEGTLRSFLDCPTCLLIT
jgi:hypothetical protein